MQLADSKKYGNNIYVLKSSFYTTQKNTTTPTLCFKENKSFVVIFIRRRNKEKKANTKIFNENSI